MARPPKNKLGSQRLTSPSLVFLPIQLRQKAKRPGYAEDCAERALRGCFQSRSYANRWGWTAAYEGTLCFHLEQCHYHHKRGAALPKEAVRGAEGEANGCRQSQKAEDAPDGGGEEEAGPSNWTIAWGQGRQGLLTGTGIARFKSRLERSSTSRWMMSRRWTRWSCTRSV